MELPQQTIVIPSLGAIALGIAGIALGSERPLATAAAPLRRVPCRRLAASGISCSRPPKLRPPSSPRGASIGRPACWRVRPGRQRRRALSRLVQEQGDVHAARRFRLDARDQHPRHRR